jgi:O-antigen/teichoic acid export membrane protein
LKERGKFARNASASVMQSLFGAVLLFALYRYINMALGVEQLGVWSVVLATVAASHLADLGLSAGVTRFVARDRARGQDTKAGQIIDTVVLTMAVLVALLGWPLFILGKTLLPLFFHGDHLSLALDVLPLALLSLWLTMLSTVLQGGLDGCQRMDLRAGMVLFGQTVLLGMAIWLVPIYGLTGLALAQVAQGSLLLVLGRLLLCRVMPSLPIFPGCWDKKALREMLSYGMNMQAATILVLLFDPAAKALMARFGGAAAAGYFEMANQVVVKVRGIVIAANQAIVPYVAEMQEVADNELRDIYAKNFRILILVVIPVFSVLLVWAGVISWLLLGEMNIQLISLLGFLTVAWGINVFNAPAYFFNMGTGRVGWNTLCHLMMASISIILGFTLGSYYGMMGVAVGYGVAIIFGSISLILAFGVVNRVAVLPIIWHMRGIFACLPVGIFGFLAVPLYPLDTIYFMLLSAVALTGLICLIALLHPTGRQVVDRMRHRMIR